MATSHLKTKTDTNLRAFISRAALFCVLAGLVLSTPALSRAAGDHVHQHGDGPGKQEPHYVMSLKGDALEFFSQPVDGVKARVLVSDVRAEMKKLNSPKTHLVAVRFVDAQTEQPIPQGYAALYLTNDHNKAGFFDPMKNNDGIFVAGLLLIKPGEQHMVIASKLLDRKTRDFHIHFTIR